MLELLKKKAVKRSLIGLILSFIILVLEIFVFNYKAFPNRGESFSVSAMDTTYSSFGFVERKDDQDIYLINRKEFPIITVEFEEEKEINSVAPFIDFEDPLVYRYEISITGYYYVDGHKITMSPSYYYEYVNGEEWTRYFLPEFNHPVKGVEFRFVSIGNFDSNSILALRFTFDNITFNAKMPFHFSLLRFFGLNLIVGGVYLLTLLFIDRVKKTVEQIEGQNKVFKLITNIVVYAIPIIGAILIYAFYGNFAHTFASATDGTQISKELVDAFMKGHVYLDEQPTEGLLALANPYDPNARSGIWYLWDHLFYNGKYYSYYGIAPVFLLFLPFRLIFGKYLYDAYGVLLFTIVGLVFMALSFETFVKNMKLKKELPLAIKFVLYFILVLGSGALFQIIRPYFYEVSTSCAYMCMMIGLFHVIKSGIFIENPQKKYFYYHLVFSSLWIALAVLSRATMALYALVHVGYLAYCFIRNVKSMNKKQIVLFLVFSLVPYVIFGSIQVIYNYLRFGSFFDFGIQYSLTIADFKNMPFHFGNVLTSLYNFLISPASFGTTPPFVWGNCSRFGSAYYFFETGATIGLLYRMPIIWVLCVLPFLIKCSWKQRLEHLFTRWVPCVIIPIVQVAITWQSGYAIRYYSDFAWPILMFAIFTLIRFYDECIESERAETITFVILVIHLVFSFVITITMIEMYVPMLTHYYGTNHPSYTNRYYRYGRELTFWR